MTRNAREAKARPLPLGIVHHAVKVTLARMPASMISLREPLGIYRTPSDQLREITACFTATARAHEKLRVFHRADGVLHTLQRRRKLPYLGEDFFFERNVCR